MLFHIQNLLILGLEVFCCKLFFEALMKKQIEEKRNTAWILGLFVGNYIISLLFANYFLLKEIAVILLISLMMKHYYISSLKITILLATFFQCFLIVIDYIVFSLLSVFLLDYRNVTELNATIVMLLIILGKIFLLSGVLVIKRKMEYQYAEMLTESEWLRFIFLPIFTMLIIAGFIMLVDLEKIKIEGGLIFMIAFGLVGINIMAFYLIQDILGREVRMRAVQAYEIQAKYLTENYRKVSKNFEKEKRKTHEYKNQINCMKGLLVTREYKKMQEYLGVLDEELQKETDYIDANNEIINAIINTAYREAKEQKTVFVIKVNDLANIPIADEDIVIILSNLLNNALESTRQCKLCKKIKLKMIMTENEFILSVRNTYEHTLKMEKEKYITTKKDSMEHGMGIKNIQDAVDKYKGSYLIQRENNEFQFTIII